MRQTWRSIGYVSAGGLTGVGAVTALIAGRELRTRWAEAERHRAGRVLGLAMPPSGSPGLPPPERALIWATVQAATGLPIALAVWLMIPVAVAGSLTPLLWWLLPEGESFAFFLQVTTWQQALTLPPLLAVALILVLTRLLPPFARAHARVCRTILAPDLEAMFAAQVRRAVTSRAEALDAHATELRRIERDLHDGSQARLVTVAIQLGLAQKQRSAAPQVADALVEKALAGVETAMVELRAVARSIYPPILADRGLAGAVRALVADCPVPLRLNARTPVDLPAAVEGAAYFVIAEALANIARHSNATTGEILLETRDGTLMLLITDDGVGGAREGPGTGLAGIRRRVAAFDGRVVLASPAGGPTRLYAELPCEW